MLSWNTVSAANLHDSYFDFHHSCLLLSIPAGASHHTQAQQVAESHLTKLQEQVRSLLPPAFVPFAGLCF